MRRAESSTVELRGLLLAGFVVSFLANSPAFDWSIPDAISKNTSIYRASIPP